MNNKKGKLIILEGGDGVGKTTMLYCIGKHHPDFIFTREPGGSPLCENIRKEIFKLTKISNDEDKLYMFHTSRLILWYNFIKKKLDEGKIIVMDRFYLSTLIYQDCLDCYDNTIDNLIKDYKDDILNIVLTSNNNIVKNENDFDEYYKNMNINKKYADFINLTLTQNKYKITKYNYIEVNMDFNKSIDDNFININKIINNFVKERGDI